MGSRSVPHRRGAGVAQEDQRRGARRPAPPRSPGARPKEASGSGSEPASLGGKQSASLGRAGAGGAEQGACRWTPPAPPAPPPAAAPPRAPIRLPAGRSPLPGVRPGARGRSRPGRTGRAAVGDPASAGSASPTPPAPGTPLRAPRRGAGAVPAVGWGGVRWGPPSAARPLESLCGTAGRHPGAEGEGAGGRTEGPCLVQGPRCE